MALERKNLVITIFARACASVCILRARWSRGQPLRGVGGNWHELSLVIARPQQGIKPRALSILRRCKQKLGQILIPRLPLSRNGFNLVRLELNVLAVRFWGAINPFYWRGKRRLRKSTDLAVNIGCGGSGKAGWVNLDLMNHQNLSLRCDCRRYLPLTSGSVNVIRCEHFFEHLDIVDEAPVLLKSCYRVLGPSGVLRIVVPDVRKYLLAYAADREDEWNSLGWDLNNLPQGFHTALDIVNHVFRQGHEHLYAYDFATLSDRLRQAGFTQIHEMSFGRSFSDKLRDDLENHRLYSLYVEAIK